MKQIICIALFALTACATMPEKDFANGPTARLNEVANLENITVRPLTVVEDSRCAAQVQCVWAGRVRITAEIKGAGVRELTLEQPAAVNGGMLTLVDVRPGKRAAQAIAQRDYQFTFRLQRP
jgi:hypothetical protein